MNILVTGSNGFIGSHLVPKLERLGHKVVGMDLKNSTKEDVRNYWSCLERVIKVECVIHLASAIDVQDSIADPIRYLYNNELGLVNLLDSCIDKGIKRFVFASSAAADNPASPYGATKLNGEHWCDVFQKCYGLSTVSTVSLRFFNVYGKGTEKGVIPIFIDKIRKGVSPVINGDGEQTRDFVYVNDVVDAIIKAMESDVNGVYEVGTGIETSVLQLCDIILTEMKSNLKIKFGKGLDGEIKESVSNKAKWFPKWKPKYLLVEQGLREMLK